MGLESPGDATGGAVQRPASGSFGRSRLPATARRIPLESFVSDDDHFNFQTYICIVKDEFVPVLSNEHMGWSWCLIDKWPKPIHQGIRNTLSNRVTRAKVDTIFELLDNLNS